MLGLRAPELILIVLAIVLLFGASRLPQLAKSLGQTRKAFREGMKEAEEAESNANATSEPKQINNAAAATLSDEELMAEMRRRTESKAS
jgi:sec-independent protein translocase protein TatA